MQVRRCLAGSLVVGLTLLLSGCASPSLVSISITPTTELINGVGLTVQYTAIGVFENGPQGKHPESTRDITNEVTWKSNTPQVATISNTGLLTSVGQAYGVTIISANMNGFTGVITAQATAVVCPLGWTASAGGCTPPPGTTP